MCDWFQLIKSTKKRFIIEINQNQKKVKFASISGEKKIKSKTILKAFTNVVYKQKKTV